MRTISVTFEEHLGKLETSYAYFLLIEPVNGLPEGYTSHDLSHTINGVLYDAESNQAPSRVPTRLKLNTDASETVMLGGGSFDLRRLKLGYYLNAKYRIFAANYEGDLTDQVTLMAGTIGQAEIEDDRRATVQLNSLAAPANKPFGRQTSPLCDCPRFGRGRCRNPSDEGGLDDGPDIATYTVTGMVQSVTDKSRFVLTLGGGLMTHAAALALIGWSDPRFLGIVRASAGDNFNEDTSVGVEEVVKSYTVLSPTAGEVVLRVPLPYLPQAEDTFFCERGCDKAWATCKLQPNGAGGVSNHFNFRGFPYIPLEAVTRRQS
ncbi:MAG TPA: DUF2163 domain-containing protein [Abditibacteriaceae bacterium]|jgi:uncharacterized phage protein (TIGR02218 family)